MVLHFKLLFCSTKHASDGLLPLTLPPQFTVVGALENHLGPLSKDWPYPHRPGDFQNESDFLTLPCPCLPIGKRKGKFHQPTTEKEAERGASVPVPPGVTTVLSMTTLMIGSRTSLPNTNCFIKAIDVYLGICFSFVFGALLEYAVAHYSSSQQMAAKDRVREGGHSSLGLLLLWQGALDVVLKPLYPHLPLDPLCFPFQVGAATSHWVFLQKTVLCAKPKRSQRVEFSSRNHCHLFAT